MVRSDSWWATAAFFGVSVVTAPALGAQPTAPRLTVVISVDQMRADYLERFRDGLTGGFIRLLDEGANFTDTRHDHAFTSTAPGHATIATGVFPSRHGIVSNDWWDRNDQRVVYAVEDRDTDIVDAPTLEGRSPANLLRPALGDWVQSANAESKVFSVAIKDRAAVLMGGQRPDGAYWHDPESGRFVTSRFYRNGYPDWVQAFNDAGLVNTYFTPGWVRLLDETAYAASREDSFPAEHDGVQVTFPHRFPGESPGPEYYAAIRVTPFADELAVAFAQELIVHETLGVDDVPDVLFLGMSAADYIGHEYGPFSQEVQDYYLRLDGYLEGFFGFLDEWMGRDAYAVVLTSDHGVPPVPEESQRRGVAAGRISIQALQEIIVPPLIEALQELQVWEQPRIQYMYGLVISFPEGTVPEETQVELRRRMARALGEADIVVDAFSYDAMRAGTVGDQPYRDLYRRSFHVDRAPDVFMRFAPNFIIRPFGTTHESPYDFDQQVPLIFWGAGISPAERSEAVRTVDIAPTVAALLGVPFPDDLDGVPRRVGR